MTDQQIITIPYDPEMTTVSTEKWSVSFSTTETLHYSPAFRTEKHAGVTLNAWHWVTEGDPTSGIIRHKLDGTMYDTKETAAKAAYDAGLIVRWVRTTD